MQLVWAENVVRKTNKRVLILTPLAVARQHVLEGEKFGIEVEKCRDGKHRGKIVVTNYERLHYFNSSDFAGVVCDESSCLKDSDSVTRAAVTEFMRKIQYRILCTATPSPNDFIELGTSSEALGYLGFMDMIGRFFKQDNYKPKIGMRGEINDNRVHVGSYGKYRFRGHAQRDFWRWCVSWCRAIRKPSDLGFEDGAFVLPELVTRQHVVQARTLAPGWLFSMPAHGFHEEREERRRTIQERCEKAAELSGVNGHASVLWCNLNDEGDLLEEITPGAVQVSGAFEAFSAGEIKRLVTKCSIAGWGLNWQHCAHQTFFPSHSFEAWYQAVRRSWRFGQKNPVTIDVVTSEGEARVLENLQRKQVQADKMFKHLVELMASELRIEKSNPFQRKEALPSWL